MPKSPAPSHGLIARFIKRTARRAPADAPADILESLPMSMSPVPTLILENRLVASSSAFFKIYTEGKERVYIQDIVPDYTETPMQTLELNNKLYVVYTCLLNLEQQDDRRRLTSVTFIPLPVGAAGDAGIFGSVAAALVIVDNYEEVMETVEEIRRPVMSALIERKINTLAQQQKGIIRKFEKDKFLLLITEDKLEYLKERRFDILSSVREIDMGNKLPVTLSIGIGVHGTTLAQTMEYARAAADLALGRGGDQALVKDRDKYLFFGGVSPEVSSNTRVRARVKLYALNELLDESRNVIVMGHRNSDPDCLGAAVGVCKIAALRSRERHIVMGGIAPGARAVYEQLIKESEYARILINPRDALEKLDDETLVIIVDAGRPDIVESAEILRAAKKLVIIDHHRKATDYIEATVLTYHEPYASSTCELICEMLQHTGENLRLKPIEADIMLAGITVDTKNFTQKTGAKTFDAAAFLRRNGADSIRVKTYLQDGLDTLKAKAKVVSAAEIVMGSIAVAVCLDAPDPVLTSAQAADDLMNVSGVQAAFVLCHVLGTTHISARSLGKVNVQIVMEKLGGGGHQTISGAQLDGVGIAAAKDMLLAALRDYET